MTDRLQQARRDTDALFAIVKREALYDRPIPERHRIIFYIGHVEAFDWNLLSGPLGLKVSHPEFDRLFAFGIDPVDGRLPSDQPADWPALGAVYEYRDRVREKLDAALPGEVDAQLLHVAIEHRLMHAETLAYMFHQLPFDRKIPVRAHRTLEGRNVAPEPVEIPQGAATLGLRRDGNVFGWDNEFDAHTLEVPAFAIDRHKVTNAQFAKFVAEGGYEHRPFWSDPDWEWRAANEVLHPIFWVPGTAGWGYRTMFEEIPLPPTWPVYVSHAEASAYCSWAGKALPSEAQWQRAAEAAHGAHDPAVWDPRPVADYATGRSAFGVEGMVGSGWEWTSTPFAPFDGFRPFPFYPGYSANFFDGKHFVMKGGSVRTATCMLRPSFRNWFQAHYQYVYAGFRCVTQ